MREHGEWYHLRCLRPTLTNGVHAEPAAVLCVVCRRGIASTAEMALTDGTPKHVSCQARAAA